jgi:ketosteroid isomerase-like protein
VRASETAFAASMASRDFQAFAAWIADDATFVNGGKPLRGKAAVLMHWERFFKSRPHPSPGSPRSSRLIQSGRLAYSEGPVSLPDGKIIARYFSTWRRESSTGEWRVVIDNGYDTCNCPAK